MQRTRESIAQDSRSQARTMYLPKFDLIGSYIYTSKEVSLLSDEQKDALSSMGTNLVGNASQSMPSLLSGLVQSGVFTQTQAAALGQIFTSYAPSLMSAANSLGDKLVDALHTDTRNMWVGAVTMTQPIYVGGKITAANKAADIKVDIARNQTEISRNTLISDVDHAYWLVIQLHHKQLLAQNYVELLRKLLGDVEKMEQEGFATKADRLGVSVKLNEAEMTLTQVDDGLVLSRMALCHVCGIPVDSDITLADEAGEEIDVSTAVINDGAENTVENRAELRMLDNMAAAAAQGVKVAKAEYLPVVSLTAGYALSNPNVFNGFQRKFSGMWNVGVMLQMPLWHWNEAKYKVSSARSTALLAGIQKEDTRNLNTLQVKQARFRMSEARKKLTMTEKNIDSAEENLRSANIGFQEGVFTVTSVMEAQTAWLKAQNQKVDAQVDLKLAESDLKHALGEN